MITMFNIEMFLVQFLLRVAIIDRAGELARILL